MSNNEPIARGFKMQSIAVQIEHKLSSFLKCERFDMGGFVNSDHIRRCGFIPALISIMSIYYLKYNEMPEKRKLIDDFIVDILYYSGQRLDDMDEDVIDDIINNFETTIKDLDKR